MFLIWAPGTYGENGHILKPYGGIVDLGDGVIRKVTDEIYLFIKSVIKADNPIEIEGTKQLILTINANDLWEEDFLLESISNIDYEGSEYIIFDGLYPLSLTELNQFIKSVEDELELRTGNYTIEIKPAVEGKIYTANQTIAIDESAYSTVNLSSDIILSETENYFSVSTPIKDTIEIPQFLYFFKYKIPVNTFKYIIIIVYTLFIFVMAIINLRKIIDKKKQQSEVELFNKKYF